MRVMYDALPGAFAGIPADAQLVAGYIDGGPGYPVMTDALWALFPNAVHVRIATQPGTNDGHVLDVEAGDATPDQAPGWVAMRRAAGVDPSVYCSQSVWQACRDAFAAQGVPEPHWWIASYQQPPDTSIPAGAVAHQWGGNQDGGYDVSSVLDYWPGVDSIQEEGKTMEYLFSPGKTGIWAYDGISRRPVSGTEWAVINAFPPPGGVPPVKGPLPPEWWATIPDATATVDASALASAIAAKLPAGSGISAQQVHDACHQAVVETFHSAA